MVGKKVASPSVISGICLTARTFAQPKSTRKVKNQYDCFIGLKLVSCGRDFTNTNPLAIETWDRGRNLIKVWYPVAVTCPGNGNLSKGRTLIFDGRLCNYEGIRFTYGSLMALRLNGNFACLKGNANVIGLGCRCVLARKGERCHGALDLYGTESETGREPSPQIFAEQMKNSATSGSFDIVLIVLTGQSRPISAEILYRLFRWSATMCDNKSAPTGLELLNKSMDELARAIGGMHLDNPKRAVFVNELFNLGQVRVSLRFESDKLISRRMDQLARDIGSLKPGDSRRAKILSEVLGLSSLGSKLRKKY